MPKQHESVTIIGAGPAGYTAAIYAARALRNPLLISGWQPGGQLTTTTDVENYPGYADTVQGPWMMEEMRKQAEHVGVRFSSATVETTDLSSSPIALSCDDGSALTTDTLIICTGATARWLGLESEESFKGFGVSACATCDGFFYRDKRVAVVGGGNTAVEEALYLSQIAKSVVLVHRRDELRAERILQDRLFDKSNIEFIWNHELAEVTGSVAPVKGVTGARLRSTLDGQMREIEADGIFIAIGHSPGTELFANQLKLTPSGYVAVEPGGTQTSHPAVFAAGDVTDEKYRQAITAAGMGCMAAMDADMYLASSVRASVRDR